MASATRTPPRATPAGITLALGGLTAGCALTVGLALAARTSWQRATVPVPRADDVIAALATLATAVLGGWLCLAGALSVALALHRAAGRSARRLARVVEAITPGILRRAVAVAVGVSLAAVTLPAQAGTEPAPPAGSAVAVDVSWGRTPTPPTPHASPEHADRVVATPRRAVVVQPGDTLWGLAAQRLSPGATDAAIAAAWPGWFAANREVIGPDPDRILPGQRLAPPR